MSKPIVVDLPHKLGAAEAKRRIQNGMGGLKERIPGGADVQSGWEGDRLNLSIKAMGQDVNAGIDIEETFVRVEVQLPAALAFFAAPIEALLRRKGTDLLEDKSGRRGG